MTDKKTMLEFPDQRDFQVLVGERGANLAELSRALGDVKINSRGTVVRIEGAPDSVEVASSALSQLYELVEAGYPLYKTDFDHAVRMLKSNGRTKLRSIFMDAVYVAADKRTVTPKSAAQKIYIDAMRNFDMIFGIGPAGTGKTYLAMAMAVAAFSKKEFKRIVLTRPAVEAGEKLGYLPGTLYDKVNPYLRPLYDALHVMMGFDRAAKLVEQGVIEVAPLAFMRGRTLDDAFVILDEAQNTTTEQMKMFLTRLGFNSKAVITGDITQIDLPNGQRSGLVEAQEILAGIESIRFCRFTRDDVVRHPLVQNIIQAYEEYASGKKC